MGNSRDTGGTTAGLIDLGALEGYKRDRYWLKSISNHEKDYRFDASELYTFVTTIALRATAVKNQQYLTHAPCEVVSCANQTNALKTPQMLHSLVKTASLQRK